jgi:hypothetical protein
LLWLYQRVFFGTVTNPKNEKLHDLTPREILTFVPLIIMALWIGLYPKPFFQILEQPVNQLVQTFQNGPIRIADERASYACCRWNELGNELGTNEFWNEFGNGRCRDQQRHESEQLSARHFSSRIPVDAADGGAHHFCARHSAD